AGGRFAGRAVWSRNQPGRVQPRRRKKIRIGGNMPFFVVFFEGEPPNAVVLPEQGHDRREDAETAARDARARYEAEGRLSAWLIQSWRLIDRSMPPERRPARLQSISPRLPYWVVEAADSHEAYIHFGAGHRWRDPT